TLGGIIFILRVTIKRLFESIPQYIEENLSSPMINRAMGILGGKSGASRRNKAIEKELGNAVFDNTLGKFAPILGALGIDLQEMLGKYSPFEILEAVDAILPILQRMGIDLRPMIQNVMQQVAGAGQEQPQNSNSDIA
ncbi:MAG: hypothetical protein KKB59_18275, partial [Spirochaetes bacterium]|nr:hypothetical protein [Spirochaetota bacterium]